MDIDWKKLGLNFLVFLVGAIIGGLINIGLIITGLQVFPPPEGFGWKLAGAKGSNSQQKNI
jgi:hypothetical protein